MERFPQTTFSNLDLKHRRGDDDASFSVAVNTCQNCGESCERLTLVPEFDYMGCDNCMAEALAVIAREAAALLQTERMGILSAAGCTPAEAIAFIKAVA